MMTLDMYPIPGSDVLGSILKGRSPQQSEAVLVLECVDVDEARHALDTLPLVREGLITFDFIPLGPYPGFARLFAADA